MKCSITFLLSTILLLRIMDSVNIGNTTGTINNILAKPNTRCSSQCKNTNPLCNDNDDAFTCFLPSASRTRDIVRSRYLLTEEYCIVLIIIAIVSDGRRRQNGNDPLAVQRQPATISTETQLDYSCCGHAVLWSFLPWSLLRRLRSELVAHAAADELSARRRKAEGRLAGTIG